MASSSCPPSCVSSQTSGNSSENSPRNYVVMNTYTEDQNYTRSAIQFLLDFFMLNVDTFEELKTFENRLRENFSNSHYYDMLFTLIQKKKKEIEEKIKQEKQTKEKNNYYFQVFVLFLVFINSLMCYMK